MQVNNTYLYQVVARACSLSASSVKEAEASLHELEIQPGYCLNLLQIITNHSLETNARCMACVCLKNAVDKYWRKTAPHAICDEERALLKAQFLGYLSEPELKIARQMSVVLGKLARFELPHQWPELISRLLQAISESSPSSTTTTSTSTTVEDKSLVHSRALMALHQIIKSLASKRLLSDRKLFEELTANIVDMLTELAFLHVQRCLAWSPESASAPATAALLDEHTFKLDQAINCLKILHKLVVHGFKDNAPAPGNRSLAQLIAHTLHSFDKLVAQRHALLATGNQTLLDHYREKYEYLIVMHVSVWADMHDTYPFTFVDVCMSECMSLAMHMCFTSEGKRLSFDKLSIALMCLVKSLIMCDKYKRRPVRYDDASMQARQDRAVEIKQTYLSKENLERVLEFLFGEYLLMSAEELEQWRDSPEEFVNDDGTATDAWKYNGRACAETLFQAFVHEFSAIVVPIVVQLVQLYSDNNNNNNNNKQPSVKASSSFDEQLQLANIDRRVLLKDASYNCVCIASWELISQLDFDMWLVQSLLAEIRSPTCHLLIKRRILMLIAAWTSIKLHADNRPPLYELLCACMGADQHMVVRLQATLTLKAMLDDIHFEKEPYLPYLGYHFGLMCQLLKQVEESDTKIKVLSVIAFLVERVDIHIRPLSGQLADYLPLLWHESDGQNMLRCSIVNTFYHLVKSLGRAACIYHPFLVPVIKYATDTQQPASVYLLEDGLELWNITVQNATHMSAELLDAFANIRALLDRDTDVWRLCLEIIDSYVVLDARQLFKFYGEFLASKWCDMLNQTIKIDALLRLMRSVGQMFEAPADNIQMHLFEPFILKALRLVLTPDIYPMIVAMCLSMLAKPVLEDGTRFLAIVERCAHACNQNPEQLLGEFLDSWVERIDMIVHPERRKLTALALISLLRFNSNVFFERFGSILNVCLTVMLDVLKEENGVTYDCLVMSRDVENDDEEVDTEHVKRKRRLRLLDPVYSVSLKDFFIEKLRECEHSIGADNFQRLMASVDKSVVQKLNELLNL